MYVEGHGFHSRAGVFPDDSSLPGEFAMQELVYLFKFNCNTLG